MPDQDQDEPGREGDVAPPVDLGRRADAAVLELDVGPHGPEDAEGHRHQEDEVPLDRGQQPAQDQADEGAGDGGHVVDAEPEPTLVGREGVGDDGRGVGEEHGSAHPLADPHGDEPDGRAGAPVIHVTESRIEKRVNTAKPRLYIFTRPNMSPTRPRVTTSTARTTMKPISIHSM